MDTTMSRRLAMSILGALPFAAKAQTPDRITIVVPYPAGGAPDYLARTIATKAGEALHKTIIVENRPGANAIVGSSYVAGAKADGSCLLLVDRMTTVANPLLYDKLPYDPKALQPVADVARVNLVLTVRSDAPFKTWSEFTAYAKSQPGKVVMGTGGAGSVHHLSLELLSKAIGAKFTHVPYKGSGPAVQDLLAGELSGVISGPEAVRPHVGSGKIRILAVGGDTRMAFFPDVPTMRELGISKTVLLPTTFSLFAPVATPESALAPLQGATRAVVLAPEFKGQIFELGLTPVFSTPEEIRAALDAQRTELKAVIQEANIRLN